MDERRGVDEHDAVAVAERVASGRASAREVLEESLARVARLDPPLNAFSVVLAEAARAEADARDAAQAAGEPLGPLHGVPVAVKEELDVAGAVTTYGGEANSAAASADAELVRRLRAAGAVVVGKTTMPEFGAFPFTEGASRGLTRNPWDPSRTPGGSSGGTAVAVATGMVPVAVGGDGGGSIRIPSACCGLFGLKPQRGRVTAAPQPHLWWALGTTGPLARSVRDAALVYDVVRGSLPSDLHHAGEAGSFVEAAGRAPGRLRVGWSVRPVTRGVRPHPEHVAAVHDTARLLAELGHEVREVDPRYPDPTAAFVPQFLAGIRSEAELVQHPERLERRTRETLRLGAWVTPRVREAALRRTRTVSALANRVFEGDGAVDVLLTPATAHRPARAGVLDGRGTVASSLLALPSIAYAALWNVAGNPAAAVPAGLASDGLPLAVQLVGRTDDEPTLLSLSAQLEAARPWSFPPAS
ncbi:amidase [Nocardioides kribbensis]|uniref:amidase n=1 Tax=Nocardioides kribbensis TaxID=305517 RepID=UPI0032D9B78C